MKKWVPDTVEDDEEEEVEREEEEEKKPEVQGLQEPSRSEAGDQRPERR